MERLIISMPEQAVNLKSDAPALFVAYIGDEARRHSFALARRLRQAGISAVVDLESRKLKRALAVADSLGARYSLIVGEDEIKSGRYTLRNMSTGGQKQLSEVELAAELPKD